jgi:hypothetical protein
MLLKNDFDHILKRTKVRGLASRAGVEVALINQQTARMLDITVPPLLLTIVDEGMSQRKTIRPPTAATGHFEKYSR